jgi:putative endonuclease
MLKLKWRQWLTRNREEEANSLPPHLALGKRGEALAVAHLKSLGYRIVVTNFRAPIGYSRNGRPVTGEIDVIAYDESETLCFVEVKTRSSADIAPPEAAVDRRKQRRIIRAARLYRRLVNVQDEPFRYDVVSILAPPDREPKVQLRRGYFSESHSSAR